MFHCFNLPTHVVHIPYLVQMLRMAISPRWYINFFLDCLIFNQIGMYLHVEILKIKVAGICKSF